ncbi:MAG TPA: tRNA-uridine aminocarboxypropyltransferase, partial [Polyangia bacterium]|nr:tRNA-uridine aminocarboxypropyltransferase [Polyangia bacterium]
HLRCASCRMHRSLCICGLLPRLATRTRVVVIIHQLEVSKPTNTGLLAARCLDNASVVYRGRGPDEAPGADLREMVSPGTRSLVLFPHPEATPLEAWRGSAENVQLIVPDGTWSQAARTRRRLEVLGGLPCVALPARDARPDRLRASPRPGRLATLEAVAVALGILEGPAVEEALMRVYRTMTERTLWTNGRIRTEEVTGGIPAGVRPHDPLGRDEPRDY